MGSGEKTHTSVAKISRLINVFVKVLIPMGILLIALGLAKYQMDTFGSVAFKN